MEGARKHASGGENERSWVQAMGERKTTNNHSLVVTCGIGTQFANGDAKDEVNDKV